MAIAGTHGKTTTTSLVATLLDAGGFDPTVINGGIINAYGTNARLGEGDWMVVEADESDGTFLKLPADVAIITNIDPEHLDHFKTFDAIKDAFRTLVENLPFYGFAVMCLDHPDRAGARRPHRGPPRRHLRREPAGRRAPARRRPQGRRVALQRADPRPQDRARRPTSRTWSCRCRATTTRSTPRPPSRSRIELGVPIDTIREALRELRRRQAPLHPRRASGTAPPIFDDYGHHPVEIAAVLRAARASTRDQVIAVVQPHRYTRLQSLFNDFATCFNDADAVIVADVYAAGEAADRRASTATGSSPPSRRTATATCMALRGAGGPAPAWCATLAKPGDYVVCLGAGNITQWAYALPGELAAGDVA